MTNRILFVDDEQSVLDGLRRTLRKHYEFDVAPGGGPALDLMADHGYAVIVSDMRMPEMSGEEFLARANVEQPDAVQIILSGQAELEATIAAVNGGQIYRFLTKPTSTEQLTEVLDRALRQHTLVETERTLLNDTLAGAVRALTEVLGLVSPEATRRKHHVVKLVARIAPVVGLEHDWQLKLAAMLSTIGYASVPCEVMERADAGGDLTPAERSMIEGHARTAQHLLSSIPRLEGVSAILAAQAGIAEVPANLATHVQVFDLANRACDSILRDRTYEQYSELLLNQFPAEMVETLKDESPLHEVRIEELYLRDMRVGMVLREDVITETGVLIASESSELTRSMLDRIINFESSTGVREPILVEYGVPAAVDAAA